MNPEICEKLLLKMFFQQRNLHVHAVTSRIVIVLQRLEKDRKNLKRQKRQLIYLPSLGLENCQCLLQSTASDGIESDLAKH